MHPMRFMGPQGYRGKIQPDVVAYVLSASFSNTINASSHYLTGEQSLCDVLNIEIGRPWLICVGVNAVYSTSYEAVMKRVSGASVLSASASLALY